MRTLSQNEAETNPRSSLKENNSSHNQISLYNKSRVTSWKL